MQSSHASSSQQGMIEQHMQEMWDKGQALQAACDYAGAEAQFKRLVQLRQRVYGAEDSDTLGVMAMQGLMLGRMQRHSEAEVLHREILQIKQQSSQFGVEHPETLQSVSVLGDCLLDQGRWKEAEPMLRKVYATDVRVLGPRDAVTLRHQMTLGNCLMHDNQLEEAEQLLRDAWEGAKLTEGTEPGLVVEAMHALAQCLTRAGKHTEAETILRSAVEFCRHRIGEYDEYTLNCMLSHAKALSTLGQHPAAEVMYRLGVQVCRVVFGRADCRTLDASHDWVECLSRQNKVEAAEGLVRETLEHVRQDLGKADPATVHWMNGLAQILMMQGPSHPEKRNEAVALLKEATALAQALPRQR